SSRYAIEEARINLAEDAHRRRLLKLARHVHLVDSVSRELPAGLSLPEKDIPIFLAAIEARVTHLITGDVRHFELYFNEQVAGLLIMSPADYFKKHPRMTSS